MDVQCEQRGCGKSLDLHDEAYWCGRCQAYFCESHYENVHEDHDNLHEQEPKWTLRLQEH